MFAEIKRALDGSQNENEFEGNLGNVLDFAIIRSYAISYACHWAKQAWGRGKMEAAGRTLNLTAKVADSYANAWAALEDLILDGDDLQYPHLTFSYFYELYSFGMRGENARDLLDKADGEGWSIVRFKQEVRRANGK